MCLVVGEVEDVFAQLEAEEAKEQGRMGSPPHIVKAASMMDKVNIC